MQNQMTRLPIPVPPNPIFERAVGYQNERNSRYLALWWEPCGDEVMASDGYVTFTGHWPGYLDYIQHERIQPHLVSYNLGSSEEPAEHRLVIQLQERQAYIMTAHQAERLLADQWGSGMNQAAPRTVTIDDLETMLIGFFEQAHGLPIMEDLMRQMEEDHEAVEALQSWLDEQT